MLCLFLSAIPQNTEIILKNLTLSLIRRNYKTHTDYSIQTGYGQYFVLMPIILLIMKHVSKKNIERFTD